MGTQVSEEFYIFFKSVMKVVFEPSYINMATKVKLSASFSKSFLVCSGRFSIY